MIKFDRLWETMEQKGVTQYNLINDYGISTGQLDRIKQNKNITTNTMDILCNILDCKIESICEQIKDDNDRFNSKEDIESLY